jgi:rhodanese-related sulfurtransferase
VNLIAEVKHIPANPSIVSSGMTIIDIRTQAEWEETGIVKGSIPITFFDDRGNYDAQKFLDILNNYVKKNEEFAIICRTGNRTTSIGQYLDKIGYKVINLQGGVVFLKQQGYELDKYQSKK